MPLQECTLALQHRLLDGAAARTSARVELEPLGAGGGGLALGLRGGGGRDAAVGGAVARRGRRGGATAGAGGGQAPGVHRGGQLRELCLGGLRAGRRPQAVVVGEDLLRPAQHGLQVPPLRLDPQL